MPDRRARGASAQLRHQPRPARHHREGHPITEKKTLNHGEKTQTTEDTEIHGEKHQTTEVTEIHGEKIQTTENTEIHGEKIQTTEARRSTHGDKKKQTTEASRRSTEKKTNHVVQVSSSALQKVSSPRISVPSVVQESVDPSPFSVDLRALCGSRICRSESLLRGSPCPLWFKNLSIRVPSPWISVPSVVQESVDPSPFSVDLRALCGSRICRSESLLRALCGSRICRSADQESLLCGSPCLRGQSFFLRAKRRSQRSWK